MILLAILNWALPLLPLLLYVMPFWVCGEYSFDGFAKWYAPVFRLRGDGWRWHRVAWRSFGGLGLFFAACVRTPSIRIRHHEARHCLQWLCLGAVFIVLYVLHSAFIWVFQRGKHPYLDNWFEVDARRAEVRSWQS